MRKLAVLFGGGGCENEISVLTGVFVMNVLDREKYEIYPVYLHTDGKTYTSQKMQDLATFKEGKYADFTRVFFENGNLYAFWENKKKIKKLARIDVALNCCHGGFGEGGGVSALMQYNCIPLASPDLTPSGLFLDKCLTKTFMRGLNVPTVECIRANEKDYRKRGAFLLKSVASRLKYPVIVKPAHLGSSIGITVAENEDEVKKAIETAFSLDDCVLIEKYLKGKTDVNCAVYSVGGETVVSEVEEAFGDGLYSFDEKYVKRGYNPNDFKAPLSANGGGMYKISKEIRDKIRAYAKTIYKRANLKGVVRMDFLVAEDKAYLCEVNTVPGSLAYYFFCERISDARGFFTELIEDAVAQSKEEKKKPLTTGILKTVGFIGK